MHEAVTSRERGAGVTDDSMDLHWAHAAQGSPNGREPDEAINRLPAPRRNVPEDAIVAQPGQPITPVSSVAAQLSLAIRPPLTFAICAAVSFDGSDFTDFAVFVVFFLAAIVESPCE
jgi:hypothetical protein